MPNKTGINPANEHFMQHYCELRKAAEDVLREERANLVGDDSWLTATGWPEDLAYSVPKKQGWAPKGMKRITPKPLRAQQSSHCTKGHELAGKNRYVTPKGNVECRRCRQVARDRYAAAKAKRHTFSEDEKHG